MATDLTRERRRLDLALLPTILLMRLLTGRKCWHCRTKHEGPLLRNRAGLWYCADSAGCRRRLRARGWDDGEAYMRTGLYFGEVTR